MNVWNVEDEVSLKVLSFEDATASASLFVSQAAVIVPSADRSSQKLANFSSGLTYSGNFVQRAPVPKELQPTEVSIPHPRLVLKAGAN